MSATPIFQDFKTSVRSIDLKVEPIAMDQPIEAPELITASRMESWNLCRRKAHYRYVEGYDAKIPGAALLFGHAWHAFLEYWWMGRRDWEEIRERCWAPFREQMDGLAYVCLQELCYGYDLAHKEEAEAYEVIALEKEFRAPLFDPSASTRNGTMQEISAAFMVGGKIDGILRKKADGSVGLKENKSTKQTIESDADPYWDKLVMDHQLSTYTIGADVLGYDAAWALYDVVRKPSIRPDKRKGEDSVEKFRPRLRENIRENLKSYFRWREIPRQHKEVFHALRDIWDIARMMEISKAGDLNPRNPNACFKYGASHRCAFYETCLGNVSLDENPDLKRSAPFQELEVPEED